MSPVRNLRMKRHKTKFYPTKQKTKSIDFSVDMSIKFYRYGKTVISLIVGGEKGDDH